MLASYAQGHGTGCLGLGIWWFGRQRLGLRAALPTTSALIPKRLQHALNLLLAFSLIQVTLVLLTCTLHSLLMFNLRGYTEREPLSHSVYPYKSCNSCAELACAADSGHSDSAARRSSIAGRYAPIRVARSVRVFVVARAFASFPSQNLVLNRLLD